ncbi:MAG TPA: glycosyltransferase, partial [Candidatus Acidoferrum sp.]|nr:glycosyltransferase [Candidatus Acidoferrum sp.]
MSSLALSMIVRDAAETLEACLASVRGVVNEMVLADTGSADGTIALAQRLGARVVSIPWTNDFAEARNRA